MSGEGTLGAAIRNGKKTAVKELLQDISDINLLNEDGHTPLYAAVDALINAIKNEEQQGVFDCSDKKRILYDCQDSIDIVHEIAAKANRGDLYRYALSASHNK